jgi:tRNA-specific adenosine deaminase 1
MASLEERISILALQTFDTLPTKSKPRIYPDGSREWVPMSAIVLVRGTDPILHPSTPSHSKGTNLA